MSYRNVVLFTALAFFGTSAFAQEKGAPDKRIETIMGTWKVQKIVSGKTEVAKNPTSGHWIEFKNDGKYIHHTETVDSGSYRLNENHSLLYLESQVQGNSTASNAKIAEWDINLTNDMLTMQQRPNGGKDKTADPMKFVYVRIEKGSKSLNN